MVQFTITWLLFFNIEIPLKRICFWDLLIVIISHQNWRIMKIAVNKFLSVILTWILFINFIYVSISVPDTGYQKEKVYQEFVQETFLISAVTSEKLLKNEKNNLRLNSPELFSLLFDIPISENYYFTSFCKHNSLNHIRFNNFLSSHFSTST